jgi:hypothetical protein
MRKPSYPFHFHGTEQARLKCCLLDVLRCFEQSPAVLSLSNPEQLARGHLGYQHWPGPLSPWEGAAGARSLPPLCSGPWLLAWPLCWTSLPPAAPMDRSWEGDCCHKCSSPVLLPLRVIPCSHPITSPAYAFTRGAKPDPPWGRWRVFCKRNKDSLFIILACHGCLSGVSFIIFSYYNLLSQAH